MGVSECMQGVHGPAAGAGPAGEVHRADNACLRAQGLRPLLPAVLPPGASLPLPQVRVSPAPHC